MDGQTKSIRVIATNDFGELRRQKGLDVDKMGFILDLLAPSPDNLDDAGAMSKALLVARPRFFGKSLAMSMLAEFFDITRDSRDLFEGLAISRNRRLCEPRMNRQPVVFVIMAGIGGRTFREAARSFEELLARYVQENLGHLLASPELSEFTRNDLWALAREEAGHPQLAHALRIFCKALCHHHGKKPSFPWTTAIARLSRCKGTAATTR